MSQEGQWPWKICLAPTAKKWHSGSWSFPGQPCFLCLSWDPNIGGLGSEQFGWWKSSIVKGIRGQEGPEHFLHKAAVGIVPPDIWACPDHPHSQLASWGWAGGWGKRAMKGVRMIHIVRGKCLSLTWCKENRLTHLSANLPVGSCRVHMVWDFSHRTLSSLQCLLCPGLHWSLLLANASAGLSGDGVHTVWRSSLLVSALGLDRHDLVLSSPLGCLTACSTLPSPATGKSTSLWMEYNHPSQEWILSSLLQLFIQALVP